MNKTGLENAPKTMRDFVMSLNKKPQKPIKPSFVKKHAKTIIKFSEKPYELIKWFLIASCLIALIVEVYYA